MELERELARLRSRVTSLTAILTLCGLWLVGGLVVDWVGYGALHWTRDGDTLRVSSVTDGPYVLTHVVARGESESEKRWAPLAEPVAIIDSEGGSIDLTLLKWRDLTGALADAPTDQRIEVLYLVPQSAKQRQRYSEPVMK